MNETFLHACKGLKTPYTPVWIMRQAGRYLPAYQQVRAKVDFLTLCKTPELSAEVTIQPVEILKVDSAILFSDILIPLEPMGIKLHFSETKGPIIENPVRSASDIDRLVEFDMRECLPFVAKTIEILVSALKVPLIGFCGAPFTLATYMIEGASSKNFIHTKRLMFSEPQVFHRLLDKITKMTTAYLHFQIEAGVHAVQIFDSWAGALSPEDYRTFALPYVQRLVQRCKAKVPVIYFAFGASAMLKDVANAGADVYGIDWRVSLSDAVKYIGEDARLQGNLDPCVLFGSTETIKQKVKETLQSAKTAQSHIFNLGHGILPETPYQNAISLVQMVHEYSSC